MSTTAIHKRPAIYRKAAEVNLAAHRLRHSFANDLLSANVPVTTIQKILGHKRLNTTLTYARAHDQTVQDDYFRAMQSVEQRLNLSGQTAAQDQSVSEDERGQLLALTTQLAEPELSLEARMVLVAQFRLVLLGEARGLQPPVGDWAENGPHLHPPPF